MLKRLLVSLAVAATFALPYAHGSEAAETEFAPQTSNEHGIKITVQLQSIPAETKELNFEVTLETHTQTLSDDLAKSSVLIASGTKYMPVAWEGAPPGGHHRKGILRFKTITPHPRSMELQIRLAGDTSPRTFKWLLK